jgi:hypothetical protein
MWTIPCYNVPYPDLIVGSVLLLVAIFAGGVEGLREDRRRG